MVDATWQMISVVGHLDLPKLHAPLPACLADLEGADSETARRLSTLLEMIAERNLALDVNLSGLRKGVGIYPHPEILRRARGLGIPVAIGTDTHALDDLGRDYAAGLEAVPCRRLPLLRLLFPGHPREEAASPPRRVLIPRPQPRHGNAQPPLCAGEEARDPAPFVRRRFQRPREGFPGILFPGLLPRSARAQGGEVDHHLGPGARVGRRRDRLPFLPPPRPARDSRRAPEHPGLGGDQRRNRVAELPAGRHCHRLPDTGRSPRAHPGGGGVRAGHRGRPFHAHRARAADAASAPEILPRHICWRWTGSGCRFRSHRT